jgi:hypothetical protein
MTDYQKDTSEHIAAVREWMDNAINQLEGRAYTHDSSKLKEPEASGFAAMMADARLSELTYGSDEYRAVLREHKPTINHHYAHNDHHPEHDVDGVRGMSLLSLLEMLCDWKAATARMKDGDMAASLRHNQDRFRISDDVQRILENTARELGML